MLSMRFKYLCQTGGLVTSATIRANAEALAAGILAYKAQRELVRDIEAENREMRKSGQGGNRNPTAEPKTEVEAMIQQTRLLKRIERHQRHTLELRIAKVSGTLPGRDHALLTDRSTVHRESGSRFSPRTTTIFSVGRRLA